MVLVVGETHRMHIPVQIFNGSWKMRCYRTLPSREFAYMELEKVGGV